MNIAGAILLMRWMADGRQLTEENGKTMLLVALLVAQKVVDETPLPNGQFVILWKLVDPANSQGIAQLNKLELPPPPPPFPPRSPPHRGSAWSVSMSVSVLL